MMNIVKYTTLNSLRKYIKLIKKNKIKFILTIFFLSFLLLFSVKFYKEIDVKYYKFVPLLIFLYAMLKLFQDLPTMNISSKLIEFKMLKFWQLKLIIIVKSIMFSLFVFIILRTTNMFPERLIFDQVVISLAINAIVNLITFLAYQVNNMNSLKMVITFICSIAYYFNSIVLISILFLGILFIFSSMKYFKYDLILPYYHSMGNIVEGLTSENMEAVAVGQREMVKSKSESTLKLMRKYYNKKYTFYIAKEISRISYYGKNWINLSVINFLAAFVVSMYIEKVWISIVVLLIIFYTSDNLLGLLNKSEAINRNKGFYFPYSIKEILKQKYIVHLIIILIPFIIPGILLLKNVSFITLILCYISLPVKNILESFSVNKRFKWLPYLIDSGIIYICFSNIL